MVKEGLFERCPMEMVFGMHNWPQMPAGTFAWRNGPIMAAVANIEITITGKGAHGAMPHFGIDPIVVAPHRHRAAVHRRAHNRANRRRRGHHRPHQRRPHLQRDPRDGAHARHCALVRCTGRRPAGRRAPLTTGIAESFGAKADVVFSRDYPATVNDPDATTLARCAATTVAGEARWGRCRSRRWAARISRSC